MMNWGSAASAAGDTDALFLDRPTIHPAAVVVLRRLQLDLIQQLFDPRFQRGAFQPHVELNRSTNQILDLQLRVQRRVRLW